MPVVRVEVPLVISGDGPLLDQSIVIMLDTVLILQRPQDRLLTQDGRLGWRVFALTSHPNVTGLLWERVNDFAFR